MNIGVIGLGFMGAVHIGAIQKLSGAKLSAICTNNAKALSGDLSEVGGNLDRGAGQYDFGSVSKYRDWQDLIADRSVDAVDICLPTDLHLPVAEAALSAGKHVLCEKPMALTAAACDEMTALASKYNRVLMIGQVLRFWPDYLFLKDFVQKSQYGSVKSATFTRLSGLPDWSRWLTDDTRSGGAILDMLVHDTDQAVALFGMPDRVSAKSMGGPDTIASTLIYEDGPEVRIQGGWFEPGTKFSMGFQVRAQKAELQLGADGLKLNDHLGQATPITFDGAPDAYVSELEYFVECCLENKKPEKCSPEDSALATKLALLLRESRAQGGAQLKCSV